ncbi:RNA-binding domain-containing protein [Olsenella sp. Marseille-P4559]|uniref:RNA-binding domain-containing protein n=1 Tax=Olsenella sp. Marseille-P4559 TaxID=2364795 RepID=UPI0013EF3648|nr:RNA-binding domain-containing protein [Olsenella sp. Marseille-P4559]
MTKTTPMDLLYQLVGYPNETEWIEFKENNADPVRIGQDISALANSAAYYGRESAYKVWGVADDTHELVGTTFDPLSAKAKGNQDLQIWLQRMLSPNVNFDFVSIEHDGRSFVVAVVSAASGQPVYFEKKAYIRVGSSTKELVTASNREAELWRRLQSSNFEERMAVGDLTCAEAADYLDLESFFRLLGLQAPSSIEACMVPLCEQGLAKKQDNGLYAITNLGALLIARRLTSIPGLRKRALRVLRFAGRGNTRILDDKTFDEGYAMALGKAEEYVMSVIPAREQTDGAFRRVVRAYPQTAIRELLSNTVIHQDLTVTTMGPLVAIYENRVEFSNPGASLIPPDRVLNALPKTRNTGLVNILRQMDLCEEGGTGWDLAVESCEETHQLGPKMVSDEVQGTRVTLSSGSSYDRMTKQERKEAVYWHTCLMYAQGEAASNQTVRGRFGMSSTQRDLVAISRLLRECCATGLIKLEDEDASARYRRYVPGWS